MALHSRDAVTVSAAFATRSRADCSSMEDRRRKSIINVLYNTIKWPYQPKHSPSITLMPLLADKTRPPKPTGQCPIIYLVTYRNNIRGQQGVGT